MDSRRLLLGAILAFAASFEAAAQTTCTFSISPTSQEFAASGGTGLVTINATPPGCLTARTASTSDAWITINFGQSGNGAGSVGYTIAQNTGPNNRTGSITIAGQTFTVTQAGTPCTFSLSPTSQAFNSDGGNGAVNINATPQGCQSPRNATTSANWITLASGASGNGAGTLVYTVSANTSNNNRTGNITIAGQTFTVTQSALSCNYTISPSSASFPATGGNDQISITASPVGCNSARTATSGANWITISFGATGNGSGTVGYTVQANNFTVARTGTMTIAGQTFTVTQAAGSCSFTLSPASSTIPSSGGTGGFNITASNQSCSWTAVNNNPDVLTLTTGDSGTGNGRIDFTVPANSLTSSRTGTITVGNATHTVTQSSTCRVSASTTGANFTGAGGSGTIAVTTQGSGCSWTATANHSFITITGGGGGTSNGTVSYSVAANTTGADRLGSISIGDFGFTVFQSSNCTYVFSSQSVSLPAVGGTGSFSVTSACPWNAVSSEEWITITPSSGSGNGAIAYAVAGNTSAVARTGTITIGSTTFRINQEGVACSVQVSPPSFSVPRQGDTYSVEVVAPSGCDWGASSTASFISIAKGDAGFNFTVAANPQPEVRKAVITAGDKTIAVTQDAAVCDYQLTPGRASFGSSGGAGSFRVATTCAWTAQSQSPWIVISQGSAAQSTGDGAVQFNVSRLTTGEGRSGSIRVGTATFAITQTNSPCAFNLSTGNLELSGNGGRGVIRVTGEPSCKWSPSKDADWLRITSWSSINGSGVVTLLAEANPAAETREGTVRISAAGAETQSVTVKQGGFAPEIETVSNAVSRLEGGPFAVGSRIRLTGVALGPEEEALADTAGDRSPSDLAGVQLLVNGIPAPLLSVAKTSIVAIVPFAVTGAGQAELVVRNNGVDSNTLAVELAPAVPAIVTADASTGRGQALANNQNGSANGASNAAARNETVTLLVTGAGQVRPDAIDGQIYRQTAGLPVPVQAITVQIGGQNAAVTAATVAPGQTAGVIRVTARIAQNAAAGAAVPVLVRVGPNATSQPGVTIAVR